MNDDTLISHSLPVGQDGRPAGPRYPLVVFDLDGTLVDHHEPIWKTLHEALGSDRAWRKRVIKAALNGHLTYAEWFETDLVMLAEAGARRADVAAIVGELKPALGASELVADLRAAGTHVAIISGGIDLVVSEVLPDVHVDSVFINHIHFDDEGRIRGGAATAYDLDHKATGLTHLLEDLGLRREQAAFVGDGANDVAIAAAAGFSVAWGPHAPPDLVAAATVSAPGPDLASLRDWLL